MSSCTLQQRNTTESKIESEIKYLLNRQTIVLSPLSVFFLLPLPALLFSLPKKIHNMFQEKNQASQTPLHTFTLEATKINNYVQIETVCKILVWVQKPHKESHCKSPLRCAGAIVSDSSYVRLRPNQDQPEQHGKNLTSLKQNKTK